MSAAVIFEQPHRNDLWRLEVVEYEGRTFVNCRKWYFDADGQRKPTRQGFTFPPERLESLRDGIADYLASNGEEDL